MFENNINYYDRCPLTTWSILPISKIMQKNQQKFNAGILSMKTSKFRLRKGMKKMNIFISQIGIVRQARWWKAKKQSRYNGQMI